MLGRCDALVFTAGIGEHSPLIRARVCAGLEGLGIAVDAARNDRDAEVVSPPGTATSVLVVPTDEEVEIATQAAAVVASAHRPTPGVRP